MEPLSEEEKRMFIRLFTRRINNIKNNSVIDTQFLKVINKRLWQLTGLVEFDAVEDLIQFQFTQFVAMVAEKAQELYGKLEYGDLIIEVKKKDPEQYRAEQKALLEKELERVRNV